MVYGVWAKVPGIVENTANPDKKQQDLAKGLDACQVPRKFKHPKDLCAAELLANERKRLRNKEEAMVPPDRVYDARENDVGWDHNRVTLASNFSPIRWDRNSQKWVPNMYRELLKPVTRVAKEVALAPHKEGNKHRGGSF